MRSTFTHSLFLVLLLPALAPGRAAAEGAASASVLADVTLIKTDNGATTSAGGVIDYVMIVKNVGKLTALSVQIQDTVPANTTSGVNPGWETVPPSGPNLPCNNLPAATRCFINIGDLAPNQEVAVPFQLTVDDPLPQGVTTIFNEAVAIHFSGDDANPLDNGDIEETPVVTQPPPDLVLIVDFAVRPDGEQVVGGFAVTNIGSGTARNVTVMTTIPAGTTADFDNPDFVFVGTSTPCVNAPAGTACEAHHPSLAPGAGIGFVLKLATTPPIDPFFIAGAASDDGSNGPDPTPANNLDDVPVDDQIAPIVDLVEGLGENGNVTVEDGDTINAPLTGVGIRYSEPMFDPAGNDHANDVTNPDNYLLVKPGPDHTFQTTNCTDGLMGDDTRIPIMNPGQPLPGGPFEIRTHPFELFFELFRMIVCGDLLIDLFSNPLDGDPTRTLRVDPYNSFANGHFDRDDRRWRDTPAGSFDHSMEDSHGSASSGSIRTTFSFRGPVGSRGSNGPVSLEQCVRTPTTRNATLSAQARLDADPGVSVSFDRSCDFFAASDCGGTHLSTARFTDPLQDTGDTWMAFSDRVGIPVDAVSARCELAFDAPAGTVVDAFLDRLFLGLEPVLLDGFETGDTSRWSGSAGQP